VNRQACAPRDRLIGLVEEILDDETTARPISAESSLSDLGMSSIQMVDLMLPVEAEFDITIPEDEISPENFFSIASIEALVLALTGV
jgi:acyl carrier protein